MIKAIIFDLDGVLIDLKDAHYECLNSALKVMGDEYIISKEDHYSKFDGLPTKKKLAMLTELRGLPSDCYEEINQLKQDYTIDYIRSYVHQNDGQIELFKNLRNKGYKLAIGSNSVRNTIYAVLVKMGILNYFNLIISNQDVNYSKPNPEMYLTCISKLGLKPEECIILEDSPFGIEAAKNSGGHVMKIKNSSDVILKNIEGHIKLINNMNKKDIWDGKNWNILVPMAGAGSRFASAGYTFPKPLIEVDNKPMIQVVAENLGIEAHFIYIVQKEHYDKYNLKYLLNLLTPNCSIVQVNTLTEGAASTTLLAKKHINNDKHLLIVNSDQFMEWDRNRFYYTVEDEGVDGGILCFESTHPKWSYAKVDEKGYVTEVAEKKPISNKATVGIYYWNKGSDYVHYAEQMISKNIRVNNEFYVCPVYNEAIEDGKKIKTYTIERMWGLGTPEDLNYYLDHYNGEY